MVSDIVDTLDPDEGKDKAEYTHEPKAAFPASRVNNPAQDGSEDHQGEILRGVEDRGSTAAFVGRKPSQEKPGQRGDAVLAEIDTHQHAMTQ